MFRANEQTANEFRQIANSPVLHSAIAHAISEYARQSPDKTELQCANKFINILLNLAEPEQPATKFPDKNLQYETPGPNQVKPSDRKK
jgi:hypothetical protein